MRLSNDDDGDGADDDDGNDVADDVAFDVDDAGLLPSCATFNRLFQVPASSRRTQLHYETSFLCSLLFPHHHHHATIVASIAPE
eukprot:5347100-Pyramimonas_sp.AAC.1